MSSQSHKSGGKVIDLGHFRAKKHLETTDSGRKPLFVSHLDGIVKGSPHFKRPEASEEFTDRILRIRQSLEKINALMQELKQQTLSAKPASPETKDPLDPKAP